jgi:hypothetical protein
MNHAMACASEGRRGLLRERGINGIDYVEVDDQTATLCVHFFGKIPEDLTAANVRIEGGRRIRGLAVVGVVAEHDAVDTDHEDCLRVQLDRIGDFSPYRVRLIGLDAGGKATGEPPAGFDRRYASAEFRFRIDCSQLDCQPTQPACPAPGDGVAIDYQAKDYASFRRTILDRLAVAMPDWRERHVPDVGIALVEVLAYVGDYLSYYQDAVATEAYLATARLRVSVRRHARLVDYALHEGCNARAWLVLIPETDIAEFDLRALYFVTASDAFAALPSGIIDAAALVALGPANYQCFEALCGQTQHVISLKQALRAIELYTWGDTECVLCRGATRATLLRTWPKEQSLLEPGDILLLEEVKGTETGVEADADPQHRWFVRLTKTAPCADALTGSELLEIEWAQQDALPFDLVISARLSAPDCARVTGVSVARGNVILVDHGCAYEDDLGVVGSRTTLGSCACPGSQVDRGQVPETVRPRLQTSGVLSREALAADASASGMLVQDPRAALPIVRVSATATQNGTPPLTYEFGPASDLLSTGPHARKFVVEFEEDRSARLRFGDGDCGAQPAADVHLRARYRAGDALAGNVEAETITRIVARSKLDAAVTVRNPLRAQGGLAPEALASAKLAIPHAFKRELKRAITSDDYAQLAAEDPRLQRAAAALDWTGSWYEARVAVDPRDTTDVSAAVLSSLTQRLAPFRRLGHDLRVLAARYVPLELSLRVCVKAGFLRGHVLADIRERLGDQALADGTLGFFHPDALTFGQGICASRVIAAVQPISGVESVLVDVLRRLEHPTAPNVPSDGTLAIAPNEIAELADDPNFPERGKLTITVGGGR